MSKWSQPDQPPPPMFLGEKERDLERENYTYELVDANGNVIKTISKEEYLAYENKPGTDEPTKATNDPDPYGRNIGGSVTNPK